MPEHDKKERLLAGETPDTERLNSVRADLITYVRVKKGLPAEPAAVLDVPVLSSLENADVIEDSHVDKTGDKVVDFSKHNHKDSIVALGILEKRIGRKKSA